MRVVRVKIAMLARTFPHFAEGQFAQAANLAHDGTVPTSREQEQLFPIAQVSQFLRSLQLCHDVICAPSLCQRRLDFRCRLLISTDLVHLCAQQLGRAPG